MCYSGKCKYELWLGDCSIRQFEDVPDDALCNTIGSEIGEEVRAHDARASEMIANVK